MSIYAEVHKRFIELYSGDDDRNEYAEILADMAPEERELWRREAEFEFSYRAGRGQRPGYAEEAERAIMEHFAEEEAAREETGTV